MKKVLFVTAFIFISLLTNAQMISITGGNLNLHGNNKGYIEVEAMQHITKNVATHVSFTKTLGGYDIAMVGARYGFLKNQMGVMLSACYMVNHKTMAMWGIDVKPIKHNPISIVYSQSTDNELKTVGIKFPIFDNHKQHGSKH
jgi:hypothetical protein